ncbi:MAG: amidase, partial [Arenicellales bacterium]
MAIQELTSLAGRLSSGELSSVELTQFYLDRISRAGDLNTFITVDQEYSLAQARESDERRAKGEVLSPLDGIPIAHKDIFCTKGMLTSCGSRILENFISPYDAAVIERFNNSGAVILGKTNMDEFAMG